MGHDQQLCGVHDPAPSMPCTCQPIEDEHPGYECKVCQSTDLNHHRECDVTCPHKFVARP